MNNCLINGVAADYLTVDDRAVHYGDGLFETILFHEEQLYFWPQHYLRLKQSAEKIKLACPYESLLLDDITKLLNDCDKGLSYAIKIIVTRGASERGYQFEKKSANSRLVFCSIIEENYSSLLSKTLLSGDLAICEQQVSINENLAGLKHLNRLENVLARNEKVIVNNKNVIDGLMLNANNYAIECTTSNFFTVKNNQLYTPKLNQSGVQGVMRDTVIKLAEKNNIEVSQSDMTIDNIHKMDEIFITNSLIGMKQINHLDDTNFTSCKVTDRIFKALLKDRASYVQAI